MRESGEEEQLSDTGNDDAKFTSTVATLKNRKQQRKTVEEARMKKRKVTNDSSNHQFNLQAAAANRQLASLENKNIIDFLRLAQESKVYNEDELRTKFREAEKSILKNVRERKLIPGHITLSDDQEEAETISSNGIAE